MRDHRLFSEISLDLQEVEAGLLKAVSAQEKMLTGIGTHLLRAGGKRLRPALFLLTAKIHEYNLDRLLPVAVSLELIHMASLVHDDVIDEAQTRRGYETANAKWGNTTAVLAGDYLFAQSFASISHIADSRIMNTMSRLVSNMCEGEIMQYTNAFNTAQTEEDYLIRIQKKTADFLSGACELGSYMAQAGARTDDNMKEFGHCIGMAFQITDDILDIMADDGQIGKPAGNDLKQGIMTLPVIYALHNSPDKNELRAIIERRVLTPEDVGKGMKIIRATDAVEYAYNLADKFIQKAKERVTVIQDRALRENFIRIADFTGLRNY